jgi:hypothetical protein
MWYGVDDDDEELLGDGGLLIGSFGIHVRILGMSGFIRLVLFSMAFAFTKEEIVS